MIRRLLIATLLLAFVVDAALAVLSNTYDTTVDYRSQNGRIRELTMGISRNGTFFMEFYILRDPLIPARTWQDLVTVRKALGYTYYSSSRVELVVHDEDRVVVLDEDGEKSTIPVHQTWVGAPLWFHLMILGVYPITAWVRGPLRRSMRRRRGSCANCGYDLAGNISGVCPECGTSISKPAHTVDGGSDE